MSSELFEVCEAAFLQIYKATRNKCSEQLPKCSGEIQKSLMRELERKVEEANVLIQDMDRELRKAPGFYRTQMAPTVRQYRRNLDQLSKDISRAKSDRLDTASADVRANHGFSIQSEAQSAESAQRARLLQGTASLTRATDSIARSHAISAETDQIGVEIMDDLGTQRESLLRTRSRLGETDENLSRSRKILNTMTRRVMTNKLLLVIIILLELCILAGVVYWKFFSKK